MEIEVGFFLRLRIRGVEYELTEEEARRLWRALNKIFGDSPRDPWPYNTVPVYLHDTVTWNPSSTEWSTRGGETIVIS